MKYLMMLMIAIGLAGCSIDSPESYTHSMMTSEELNILVATLGSVDTSIAEEYYPSLLSSLSFDRKEDHKWKRPDPDTIPFCGYGKELALDESNHRGDSYVYKLREKFNVAYPNIEFGDCVDSIHNSAVVPERDQIAVTGTISLALFDELIESARECNRSKTKLLELTEENNLPTVDQYEEIMATVVQCKRFKLEKELQK